MRVALLTNFIPPYRLSLFRALAEQAGELRVLISTRMEKNRLWTPDWSGLDVVVQRALTLNRTWATPDFQEDIERHIPYDTLLQLRRWAPDVVIAGELGARTMQAIWYSVWTGTPVVVWATLSDRLEMDRSRYVHRIRRRLLARADAVIVNGESGARYTKRLGVPEDRVLRVPYTTDMRELLVLPLNKPDLRLLYIGAFSERKGVHRFLDGVAAYAHGNASTSVHLTLVGDGPLRESLQRRTLPGNVVLQWVQHVDYHDLPRWFAAGSVFVFPTLGDEWGVVVNEALAAGLPVLGSIYSQAVEELIRDGENGWVFRPDGPAHIAAALERVYGTTAVDLMRMREEARATARQLEPHDAARKIVARLETIVRAKNHMSNSEVL